MTFPQPQPPNWNTYNLSGRTITPPLNAPPAQPPLSPSWARQATNPPGEGMSGALSPSWAYQAANPPGEGPYSAPTPPRPQGGGGGGAGGGDNLWNGYNVIERGPNGNVLVNFNGQPKAFDNWGNEIPHLWFGYNDKGQPDLPQYGGPEQPPAIGEAPAAPGAGIGVPPQQPQTFYSPAAGTNYLQFGNQFLGYLDPNQRLQMDEQLQGMGFNPTGNVSGYGETTYVKPPEFDPADLESIMDPALRQWLRFFMGQLGYGQSYQLPGSYSGSGLPAAPAGEPNPWIGAPPTVPGG